MMMKRGSAETYSSLTLNEGSVCPSLGFGFLKMVFFVCYNMVS